MRKTLNGKSSRCDVSIESNCHRLNAVLDYSFCEVRPGVGPVKKMKSVIAGSGITHVTCIEWKMFDIFYKSGTAELTSSLDIAGDEVFLFFRN